MRGRVRPGPRHEDAVQVPRGHRGRAGPGPLDDQVDPGVIVGQRPPGDHPVQFERVADHAEVRQHGQAQPLGHHQLAHLRAVGGVGESRWLALQQPVQVAVHDITRSHHDERLGEQVGGVHRRLPGQRAARRHDDDRAAAQQRGGLQRGRHVVAVEVVHQAQVEAAQQ